jgi:hypothetical protein
MSCQPAQVPRRLFARELAAGAQRHANAGCSRTFIAAALWRSGYRARMRLGDRRSARRAARAGYNARRAWRGSGAFAADGNDQRGPDRRLKNGSRLLPLSYPVANRADMLFVARSSDARERGVVRPFGSRSFVAAAARAAAGRMARGALTD